MQLSTVEYGSVPWQVSEVVAEVRWHPKSGTREAVQKAEPTSDGRFALENYATFKHMQIGSNRDILASTYLTTHALIIRINA